MQVSLIEQFGVELIISLQRRRMYRINMVHVDSDVIYMCTLCHVGQGCAARGTYSKEGVSGVLQNSALSERVSHFILQRARL